jgi:MoaA/NifB/PqqE/SkfB family radical SAM enzyme
MGKGSDEVGLLYSKTKIFYFRDKVESLPLSDETIKAPIQIRIKPTNACAHNCWYCAYRADSIQLGKDMVARDSIPERKMMEIVDDIIEMGVKAVTFSGGGDPFYYPYLLQTVKRLSGGGVKFASLTNGARLEGEIASLFARHGTWLRISLDGWDDKSYSAYRRVPDGEHSRLLKNIESFVKLGGRCSLGVYLIVDQDNASHIYDMVKVLKEIGVHNVKVAPCIISDSGRESNEYHRCIFELVREQVSRITGELADGNFEIFDAYHEQLDTFEKNYDWCPFLQITPVIGADQNVYSCHDKAYNLAEGLLGSIKEQGFKDFWFSGKNKFFRINPSRDCIHHCVVNEKNRLLLDYLNTDKEHLEFV